MPPDGPGHLYAVSPANLALVKCGFTRRADVLAYLRRSYGRAYVPLQVLGTMPVGRARRAERLLFRHLAAWRAHPRHEVFSVPAMEVLAHAFARVAQELAAEVAGGPAAGPGPTAPPEEMRFLACALRPFSRGGCVEAPGARLFAAFRTWLTDAMSEHAPHAGWFARRLLRVDGVERRGARWRIDAARALAWLAERGYGDTDAPDAPPACLARAGG
jgi:hypothetical protein